MVVRPGFTNSDFSEILHDLTAFLKGVAQSSGDSVVQTLLCHQSVISKDILLVKCYEAQWLSLLLEHRGLFLLLLFKDLLLPLDVIYLEFPELW